MELELPAAIPPHPGLGAFGGSLPGISVIIPAYEDTPILRRAVWSIRKTIDMPVQLIVSMARQSVAKNRNAGLREARHDLIAFLDDDVLLPACWTSLLATRLLADERIGVVAAKMTGPGGEPQNDLASLRPDEERLCLPPGTCFMYSRSRTEGCVFDEAYVRSQWEDTDFMFQIHERNLRCVATGAVHILHENHWTNATDENWQRNRDYFFEKWPNFEDTRWRFYDEEAANERTSASYASS